MSRPSTHWLRTATPTFTVFASLAGFITYFSMYAFRKPFAAATYPALAQWHFVLDFKIALVLAQVVGYGTAKFLGIKIIAAMRPAYRGRAIVGLVVAAWLTLLLFAVAPPWVKIAALFGNGLFLGLIWGLVFGYMEGRRTSEILGAVLCASFIVASGAVKSVGILLMQYLHVPEFWMPAATGLLFLPLLLLGVWGLTSLPPPDALDEAARVRRAPMTGREVRAFLAEYWVGVMLLVITYVFATALRDFRDNFAAELWSALGYADPARVFTSTELPVAAIALFAMGVIVKVQDNLRALALIHGIILAGLLLLAGSTLAFDLKWIGPLTWMVATGAGLYLVYTPFNAMLFDRLVAYSGRTATAGFLIYVADAAGYAGSCALLLWRNFGVPQVDWLTVYRGAAYTAASAGVVLIAASLSYFNIRSGRKTPARFAHLRMENR